MDVYLESIFIFKEQKIYVIYIPLFKSCCTLDDVSFFILSFCFIKLYIYLDNWPVHKTLFPLIFNIYVLNYFWNNIKNEENCKSKKENNNNNEKVMFIFDDTYDEKTTEIWKGFNQNYDIVKVYNKEDKTKFLSLSWSK